MHVQLPDGGMPVKVSTAPGPTFLLVSAGAGLECRLLSTSEACLAVHSQHFISLLSFGLIANFHAACMHM